jgi:hypothetical protein
VLEGSDNHPPPPTSDIDNLLIHCDPHTRVKITDVIRNYPDVFSGRVGRTRLIEHEILLKNKTPIVLKSYSNPHTKKTAIDNMIRYMEHQGLVEQRTSPWAAPVVLAKKRGSPRLCINYRRLNDVTEFDAYPMSDLNILIRQM